jgi:hypothetical protein
MQAVIELANNTRKAFEWKPKKLKRCQNDSEITMNIKYHGIPVEENVRFDLETMVQIPLRVWVMFVLLFVVVPCVLMLTNSTATNLCKNEYNKPIYYSTLHFLQLLKKNKPLNLLSTYSDGSAGLMSGVRLTTLPRTTLFRNSRKQGKSLPENWPQPQVEGKTNLIKILLIWPSNTTIC